MRTLMLTTVVLIIALTMMGCASRQKVETMEGTIQSLASENTNLRNRIAELEGKMERGDASLRSEIDASKAETLKLKESLAEIEKKMAAPFPEPAKEIKEEKKVSEARQIAKIKILSGTGDKRPAVAMATKLKEMGHRVARIDIARKRDYKTNIIYYKDGYQAEAERLAKEFEGETKPLFWKSEFDLIVIIGKSAK